MNQIWIERLKTIALTTLVLFSFILTGYLFYSLPAYQDSQLDKAGDNYVPPYISTALNLQTPELSSPYQLIVHRMGTHSLLLPKKDIFSSILEPLVQANITQAKKLEVSPTFWNTLFNQSSGLEFQFPRDVSIHQLGLFFKQSLDVDPLNHLQNISRVWLTQESKTKKTYILFISDKDQVAIQAALALNSSASFEQLVQLAQKQSTTKLSLLTEGGQPPWDITNRLFTHSIYIPVTPLAMNEEVYKVNQIDIDSMKRWLFPEPNIEPVDLKNKEVFYVYNNQMLAYNSLSHAMIYNDTSTIEEKKTPLVERDFDQINSFMQRHKGWTGPYQLDEIVEGDDANQYAFRLFVNGYPLYIEEGNPGSVTDMNPSLLQITVKNSVVTKYVRSMYYLGTEPKEKHVQTLPTKTQLLTLLRKEKVALSSVTKLFPGYKASFRNSKQEQFLLLRPCWVVITTDGKCHLIELRG